MENTEPSDLQPLPDVVPGEGSCATLIGSMKGKIRATGDIFSTGIAWDAES